MKNKRQNTIGGVLTSATAKLLFFIIILILLVSLVGCTYTTSDADREINMYCGRIYELIWDADFAEAQLSSGTILLYDENAVLTETVEFERYDEKKSARIKRIDRDDFALYFVFGEDEDSEIGIVFFNDTADGILTWVNTLERIGEGAYLYDTVLSEEVKLP